MVNILDINKNAAELVVLAEKSLNRELTNLEKVAVLGFVTKSLGSAYKGVVKPLLSKKNQAAVSSYGNTVKTTWDTNKRRPLTDKVSKTFLAASRNNPTLTLGATMAAGAGADRLLRRANRSLMYPLPPVYAALIEAENSLEKIAKEKDESNKDKWLYAGAGAAGGLLLGIRNKRILDKLKREEILKGTENLRGLGNSLAARYKEFSAKSTQEFEGLFNDITDPKKRRIIRNTTKEIDNLINETKRRIPKSELRTVGDINKELMGYVDKAYNSGEISPKVADFLRNSINTKFRPLDVSSNLNISNADITKLKSVISNKNDFQDQFKVENILL